MNLKNNLKKRFFEYKLFPSVFQHGKKNTIADVPGVLVGHITRIEGSSIRTGVTVIDPGVPSLFRNKLPAAVYVGNGSGKVAGFTQIQELGTLEAPIALTNTLAVGTVMRAIVDIAVEQITDLNPMDTINAVVGETNDGFLNDIHLNTITSKDVRNAYNRRSAEVAVGNVGAGTGTRAFAWKGGIGSASRTIFVNGRSYTVGVLVQTNFGGSLVIGGVPIGRMLGKTDFEEFGVPKPDGSCMIVLATDAPVNAFQLRRIVKRAVLGIVRTGSILSQWSGDYGIAFSVNRDTSLSIPDTFMNQFFLAAMDGVEESVYDALFAAESMTGRGNNTRPALPLDQVLPLLKDI